MAYRRAAGPTPTESGNADQQTQPQMGDKDEGEVFEDLEQVVAALLRLFTFCGVPSPWEAVNMLKCGPPFFPYR